MLSTTYGIISLKVRELQMNFDDIIDIVFLGLGIFGFIGVWLKKYGSTRVPIAEGGWNYIKVEKIGIEKFIYYFCTTCTALCFFYFGGLILSIINLHWSVLDVVKEFTRIFVYSTIGIFVYKHLKNAITPDVN